MQTFTTYEYGLINLANEAGFDKLTYKERIVKGKDILSNTNNYLDSIDDKDKALFLSALQLLEDLDNRIPTGKLISLDATSSGVQLMSLLTRDEKGMKLTNTLQDKGKDIRQDLYQTGLIELKSVKIPLYKGVSRSDIKNPIMIFFYNSTRSAEKIIPDKENGQQWMEEIMSKMVPGAAYLKNFLHDNRPLGVPRYEWVLPDGFSACVETKQKIQVEENIEVDGVITSFKFWTQIHHCKDIDRSLSPNLIHSLDSMIARDLTIRASFGGMSSYFRSLLKFTYKYKGKYKEDKEFERLVDLAKLSNYMSSRILLKVNETNISYIFKYKETIKLYNQLINSLPSKSFRVLCIHDCFRILATYGNLLRRLYNQLMYEVYMSNILNFLLVQVEIPTLPIKKPNINIANRILEADYSIT